MLEEEDESQRLSNEKQGEEMENGRRTEREIRGLSPADVSPAEVVAAALSEYLPQSKEQSQKHRRGRPKKVLHLKKLQQGDKELQGTGTLHSEPGILKTSPTPGQKKSTDLERALENGSLKGMGDQVQELTSPESGRTAVLIQDSCPPCSDKMYHITKSNTETHSQERTVELICRQTDDCPRGEEGRCVVLPLPSMSNLSREEKIKTENAASLHPTARQIQQSWKKTWQGRGKGDKQQEEDVQTAESRTLTRTSTLALPLNETEISFSKPDYPPKDQSKLPSGESSKVGELLAFSSQPTELNCIDAEVVLSHSEGKPTSKLRNCPSSNIIPKSSQNEMLPGRKVIKQQVDGVMSLQSMGKFGRKGGRPPKKNRIQKTQGRKTVSCPQECETIQSFDNIQENSATEKRVSGTFNQYKNNLEPSSTEGTQLDSNACQSQPDSGHILCTESKPVMPIIKPKKKVGRPRKLTNIVTAGPMGTGGHDSSASVKEATKNLKAVGGEKLSETMVSDNMQKRGRGRHRQKSDSVIPHHEQAVGKVLEKNVMHPSEILSPSRKSSKQTSDKDDTALRDLRPAAPNLIGPLPHKRKKRGRKKMVSVTEKTSENFFEQHSSSVSQQVHQSLLPPSKMKTEQEGTPETSPMYGNSKEALKAVKEGMAVLEENKDAVKDLVGLKTSGTGLKLKRKIGRPLKKKTLIKMAKQLALAQVSRTNSTEKYMGKHPDTCVFPENIPLHQPKMYKVKRERKKVELWSPVTQLRRYNRACKTITDYSVEKLEHRSADSHHRPVWPSFSGLTDPHLISENQVSPSSAVPSIPNKGPVTAEYDGRDLVKQLPQKRGKPLKNKRKYQEVNIKVEEVEKPEFDGFTKMQNPSAFEEITPVLTKETWTVSESVHSSGDGGSQNLKIQCKARKVNRSKFKVETGQSLNSLNLPPLHSDIAEPQEKIPLLVPKDELIGTTPDTDVVEKAKVSHKCKRSGKSGTSGHAVTLKKVEGKVEIPHKKARVHAQIKYEPTQELSLNNASPQIDGLNKSLPPSAAKGPRRRGRPRKNAVVIQPVKSEQKKGMVSYDSLADQNFPVSQECPIDPPEKAVSYLNLSANVTVKKPRKVDKRRKKFRNLKAQALKGLSDTVVKPSESVEQFTSQVANKEEVNRCSQKLETSLLQNSTEEIKAPKNAYTFNTLFLGDTGMTSSVQQLAESSDADALAKRPRKVIGSRKRRRRKRSWWDDRGKAKDETNMVTTLETPPLSVQDRAEVGVFVNTDMGKKVTSEEQLITAYQNTLHNPNELISAIQVLPKGSEKDCERILEAGKISPIKVLSEEETSSERLDGHQGNVECQKIPKGNQFPATNISENQRQVSGPDIERETHSALVNTGTPLESCKIMNDTGSTGEPQDIQMSRETTSASLVEPGVDKLLNILETDKQEMARQLISDPPRRKPGRPRKGYQQKQNLENEQRAMREKETVMLRTKEADLSNSADLNVLVSTESETPDATNINTSDTITEEGSLSEVLSNSTNVEILTEGSSQLKIPNQEEWRKHGDGVEQSDQEVEEAEGNNVEDLVENMKGEQPETSKPRGPGRPPKFKGKKPVECHFCGRSFHHISAYIIHRRIHTGEKPYSCQECGKTFAQLSNLNTHRKIHKASGDLRCPYCSSIFSNRDELLAHCQVHTQDSEQPSVTEQVANKGAGIESQPTTDLASSSTYLNNGKPHICSVCGKGFRYSSMLKIHMRVHSGEKPYSCKVCGKAFSQACSVRVHEKIHWSVKPYVCTMCGKGFSQLGTLRTHFYTHMGECQDAVKQVNSTITFQCRICNKSFGHWQQYNLHLRTHIDVQLYACDICGQKYSQMSDFNVHRQSCRKPSLEEVAGNIPLSQIWQKSQVQKDEPFQTQLQQSYPIQSYQQYQPQAHQQTFTPSCQQSQHQAYELTPCETSLQSVNPQPQRTTPASHQAMPKRYLSSKNNPRQVVSPTSHPPEANLKPPLHYHHSNHCFSQTLRLCRKSDPRKYLCPRCGRLFRHLGRLRAHMLTHVRGHSYTCGRCGKTLENWNKFWLHQRVHRQKRGRFFCPKCGQGFRFAGMYKEHMQEHKEPKAFVCPSCPGTYSSDKALRAHQRDKHKACKPHKCNICGKSFFQLGKLERHHVRHHPTHKEYCSHCNLSFPHLSALQEHIKTHANPHSTLPEVSSQLILPYQCGECDTSFKTLDLLFRHQRCHSPPRDRKPWRNGEIVGQVINTVQPEQQFQSKCRSAPAPKSVLPLQAGFSLANSPQKKNPYVFPETDNTCVPSSTTIPQVSPSNTNPADHHDSSQVCHPDASQQASNKPGQPCNLQSLENHTRLPQTLSPSTAVPFSEAQPLTLPSHIQSSTSVQLPTHTLVQTSPNPEIEQKRLPLRPLRTYEKSMRGVPKPLLSTDKLQIEEESRESLECAECGAQFNFVPELYEHYLQHARGEV